MTLGNPLSLRRMSARRWAWAVTVLVVMLSGCSSNDYLVVRKAPRNPLTDSLQLLSRGGPRPTLRTEQLLRRYDLIETQNSDPLEVLAELQQLVAQQPTSEAIGALSELAYIRGHQARLLGAVADALNWYSMAVAHSYYYLFDPRFDHLRNPYDPQFRKMCDVYNSSLEAALRIVHREGQLIPGHDLVVDSGTNRFHVRITVRGPWRVEDFERFEFVSDYEIRGLKNRYHSYGLGVPLIAVRRSQAGVRPEEQFYPPGLSFPVTAFLRVGHSSHEQTNQLVHHCVLELHNPLASTETHVAGRRVPLETDISTALGYTLDNPAYQQNQSIATWGLLNPAMAANLRGLYMVEPYDPERIPVLMIHGLWSSPLTWMEMFNDLRSFPEIRSRYQFWFYLYPSGQPIWASAAQLRSDLAEVRGILDPAGQNPYLQQMVLVGHSMGGLLAELQTIDSGDRFWQLVSKRPFAEIEASEEVKNELAANLFFAANPGVRRVVTIGTPHRGSRFSNHATRFLADKLIQLPATLLQWNQELLRENPGAFHDSKLLTITTSFESLAPGSAFLMTMLEAPRAPWVQHHNIVGLVPASSWWVELVGRSDGVVSYDSAHLDQVQSELVVNADHSDVHRHPRTILELRRILLEHAAGSGPPYPWSPPAAVNRGKTFTAVAEDDKWMWPAASRPPTAVDR